MLWTCLRNSSIKLVWELWLYMLYRAPWVVLGLKAVDSVQKPVSIWVLRMWTRLSYCQMRHHEWFISLGWIWALLLRQIGYTFHWPSWSPSAFHYWHHCLLMISPILLEIQTILIVSQEECQGWCLSGLCTCPMMMVIITRSSLSPCQLLKDWKKRTVPFGLIISEDWKHPQVSRIFPVIK